MTYFRNVTWPKKALLLTMDMALIGVALYFALALRFETWWSSAFINTFARIVELLCIYITAYLIGGIYNTIWRYAGVDQAVQAVVICAVAGIVSIAANMLFGWGVSRVVLCLLAIITLLLTIGARIAWRMVRTKKRAKEKFDGSRTSPRLMIIGAGMAGSFVVNMCRNDPCIGTPVVFVDDDPLKQKLRVQGVLVAGKSENISELVAKHDIQDIIIALPSVNGSALSSIVKKCKETNCRVRISSRIQSSDNICAPDNLYVRELDVSDFLIRDEIVLDKTGIADYLTDRTVLVTGGGGSIGSELCRQIMRFKPKLLVVFDAYENCAYELQCELRQANGIDCPVEVRIGSVRDKTRLNEIFDEFKPQVVFHAAAHKHVPLMENSPAEAIKNNVFGTLNTLEAASAHKAERFVLLSTDKAVDPTNIMGASKRITEMLIEYYSQKSQMKCMAVRFGNVLGSHGSVIPLFVQQIKMGGPVMVTHRDITRYFMTIPEAAQLVLQAGSSSQSGSLFVLDMGEQVRIYDLAEQLIRFYGYEPNVTMNIEIGGLRPGEKLYEELLTKEERNCMQRTNHDRIMVVPMRSLDEKTFEMQLENLYKASKYNDWRVAKFVKVIVPEFMPETQRAAKAVI